MFDISQSRGATRRGGSGAGAPREPPCPNEPRSDRAEAPPLGRRRPRTLGAHAVAGRGRGVALLTGVPPTGRGRPARPQRGHGGSSDEASYPIKMCGGAARGHPTQAGDRNGAAPAAEWREPAEWAARGSAGAPYSVSMRRWET